MVVIKLGGDVLQAPHLAAVAQSLAQAHAKPSRFVVVHGGGAQVSALCQKLGVPTQMVAGRRITDEATLDVLQMVVGGQLNIALCAALQAAGVRAVGLHAGSGVVQAMRRPPRVITGGPDTPIDLGFVGDVAGFDFALLQALWQDGRLPVLSCLGWSGREVLNLNADLVASRLAVQLSAHALVAVTGVGGVRRVAQDPSTRLARLTVAEAKTAIVEGTVTGGMIPKLEEAFVAMEAGVPALHIVGPTEVAMSLSQPGSVGTLLTA